MELWSVPFCWAVKKPSGAKMTDSLESSIWYQWTATFKWNSRGREFTITPFYCSPAVELWRHITFHRGPPLYLSPRDGSCSVSPRAGPLPLASGKRSETCVCLKTRLNPPQQLPQIRSQLSTKGGGWGWGVWGVRGRGLYGDSQNEKSGVEPPVWRRWHCRLSFSLIQNLSATWLQYNSCQITVFFTWRLNDKVLCPFVTLVFFPRHNSALTNPRIIHQFIHSFI